MGDFKAGRLLIGLTLYFLILGIFLSSSNTILTSIGMTPIGLSDNDALNFNLGEDVESVCTSPRFYIGFDGEIKPNPLDRTDDCDVTRGVYNESICTSISGCSWENGTYLFGLVWLPFGDSYPTCRGNVNVSHYNDNDSSIPAFSLCDMSGIQDDAETCSNLMCTFITTETELSDTEMGSTTSWKIVWVQVKSAFTLRFETGLPSPYNETLLILMLYLPLIAMLVCIYFMLPFIH